VSDALPDCLLLSAFRLWRRAPAAAIIASFLR
jgi:hypothetical protein